MDANLMRYLTADMQAGIDDREPLFLHEWMLQCPRCGHLHTQVVYRKNRHYNETTAKRFCPACQHSWSVSVTT